MKKTVFFLLLFFSLLTASEVLAITDSEYQKALDYYNRGKYKEAARLLKEYVDHKPDAGAYYRLGYSLYKIKRFAEADEAFREAYLLDPSITPRIAGPAKQVSRGKQHKTKKAAMKRTQTLKEPETLPSGPPEEQRPEEAPPGTDLQR